ncbi:NACHT domain-containing protein [Piscinibacter sp.]|uniref:NACHT domain-containing protein n=1 Tax=Piscinibacter sp. TaxID=1903157 RepID=UPI001E19861C|nr:NACHT domain-containing protein [Piscinibacter sp.]MBK7532300.1 ATP-binding protein [Piscinibacter sp.]
MYQNLVGLRLLCDWLDDPGLYEWVRFEADHDEVPQGLDDIVAQRRDGLIVLLQVKFTVDAQDAGNALTWDWLLARKPRGRSLLQKWCDALSGIGAERVHAAALVTNRIPSRECEATIDASSLRVTLDSVDAAVRSEIFGQLGGEDRARAFFDRFEFRHSYQGADALERSVVDRFISQHGDRTGWLALFREAIDWAVRRNFPPPDGRITLDLLRGTVDVRRPRPLEQSFRVPDGYQPPDGEFADGFLRDLDRNPVLVLWGSPGQGKSTFLSHVCRELDRRGLPYIRHHYFLDLGDRSDRFTLGSVANSLISQMEVRHFAHVQGLHIGQEHLRGWIEACANGYASEGKRFIVVIDGLDHVWRENDRDRQPLDSLFRALLPVPANVTLVMGTQKVTDEKLPSQFGRFVDADAWRELPRMSLVSIESWLRAQLDAGRFESESGRLPAADSLVGLARAFQDVTGSHPLVLTYSFEALVRQHRVLEPSTVRSNALAPDGDIRKYYGMLWQQLPNHAKDALHLLADTGFIWPPLGLETCLGTEPGELSPAIGHLLHNSEAGQVAFHGSLYAFVREITEHAGRVQVLLPGVVAWLQNQAPRFHRWGWQWLYEARAGDPRNLLARPDRNWVIESLAAAYPQDQVEAILGRAEEIAFSNGDFADAIRIRWLKTRVYNGPQFQVDDYERLYACALQLTDDEFPLKTLASGLQTASIDRLHLLGSQYLLAGRTAEATECLEQMRRRINDRVSVGAYAGDEYKVAVEGWLQLAAGTGRFEPERILSITGGAGTKDDAAQLLDVFLRELTKKAELAPLMAFVCLPMALVQRVELELACLRLAGALRAKVHEWPAFARFSKHPLSACWRLLYQKDTYRHHHFNECEPMLDVAQHSAPSREVTQRYLHRFFFARVARCLSQRGAAVVEPAPVYGKRAWLTEACNQMAMLADTVGALLARHEDPAFALPFRLLHAVRQPEGYEAVTDHIPFRDALTEVSGDLFLLTALRTGRVKVSSTEWAYARKSQHFASSSWCDRFAGPGLDLLDRELVGDEIDGRARDITTVVTPFNERAASYVELCQLATTFGLRERADALLRRSLACVIGYGWRKDPTISFALDAVKAISPKDRAFATDMLRRLVPVVLPLGDITEDSGTRPSDLAALIIDLMPEVFAAFYNHCLMSSEWYTAANVFAELLSSQLLDDPAMPVVAAALWDSTSVAALRGRAAAGDSHAQALITANAERFGLSVEELGSERERHNSPEPEEPVIDVTAYSASSVQELQAELRSRNAYVAERRIVRRWFEHWLAQGRGIELLRSLEPLRDRRDGVGGIADILDQAFETSLSLEGRETAYRWLVAAQLQCRGWDEYQGLQQALRRYATFAAHYRDRWRQFISDTTRPDGPGGSLSIPHHRLVHFLLAVDEIAAARSVVEAMVDTIVEDFSDQPLTSPAWLGQARA